MSRILGTLTPALLVLAVAGLTLSTPAAAHKSPDHDTDSGPFVTDALLTGDWVVSPGVFVLAKGMKQRRQVRFARWLALLDSDRLAVYQAEGFPVWRHRENYSGSRTEHWTYPDRKITYVFNEDGRLLRRQIF